MSTTQHRMLLTILAVATCLSLLPATQAQNSCTEGCPKTIYPVCANGKEFNNECLARCAGYVVITPSRNGNCNQAATPAASAPSPVTQANGNTANGSAKPPCACPRELNPVCGVDGAYFPNPCLAKCVGTKLSDKKPKDGKCGYIIGQRGQLVNSSATGSNNGINNGNNSGINNGNNKGPANKPQETAVATGPRPAVPATTSATNKPCNCPDNMQLVCGSAQGKVTTYQNACTAKCLGAQVVSQGACKGQGQLQGSAVQNPPQQQQQPTTEYPGGDNGSSQSALPTNGGPSIQGCSCPRIYEPVCSTTGETHANACVAVCADAEVAYEGECQNAQQYGTVQSAPQPVNLPLRCLRPCPRLYLPVCAFGITYPNLCTARCSGIPRYPLPRPGVCR